MIDEQGTAITDSYPFRTSVCPVIVKSLLFFQLLSLGSIQFLFYIEEKFTVHVIHLDEIQELLALPDGAQESEMSSNYYL